MAALNCSFVTWFACVLVQGLEAQLMGTVVRKERPELEEQKDSLVINIASSKRKLQELEDEILRLFSFLSLFTLFNSLFRVRVVNKHITSV